MSKWKRPDGKWKRVRPSKRYWKLFGRGWAGMITGAAGGAVVGSVVPGIGTLIGAGVGAFITNTGLTTYDWVSLYEERKKSHPHENRKQRFMAIMDSMMEEKEE
jgi:phage tail tape-measure protein